jgi:glycosyltransferase involved in cell wall biosynthesis
LWSPESLFSSTVDTIFVNGKFAAQRTTGVQRVARQLLCALDQSLLTDSTGWPADVLLLVPPGSNPPLVKHIKTAVLGPRKLPLVLWEQALLPWAARRGRLLNLSGSAPLLGRRRTCLIHDAAVFDRPHAYSTVFRSWYRGLFWLLPRLGAQLLTVSDFSRRRLAAALRVSPATIGLVPGGAGHLADVVADPSALARHGLVAGRYFLAVASVNANKNLPALRAAFAALPSGHGLKLVLVGDADPKVFGRSAADTPVDQAAVVCTGPIEDAALKALYQHALALVFPSLYEGFGLPPLEAMACACPVAASNAAAIPEVCSDAVLYFDPASVEQISAAMLRLSSDDALRERLRQAGLARAARFGWPQSAQALQAHLRSPRPHVGEP